jgi:hypothetical protein
VGPVPAVRASLRAGEGSCAADVGHRCGDAGDPRISA